MRNLTEWKLRHNISDSALAELANLFRCGVVDLVNMQDDESRVMAAVRLSASAEGWTLMRNNVGAGKLSNGRFMRWGLSNESQKMNRSIKSSDLIGFKPNGQFVARECKRPGWKFTGTPHELAQLAFITMINLNGGDAKFTTGTLE